MATKHRKSEVTVLFDVLRYALILGSTVYSVVLLWRWNWIVALVAVIPAYIILLKLWGFLTLPLYAFTPENKLKASILRAAKKGKLEKAIALYEELEKEYGIEAAEEVQRILSAYKISFYEKADAKRRVDRR